jgi:hypothetical protein
VLGHPERRGVERGGEGLFLSRRVDYEKERLEGSLQIGVAERGQTVVKALVFGSGSGLDLRLDSGLDLGFGSRLDLRLGFGQGFRWLSG